MYTQCPQCKTVFEISAEHLKAASGDVRCGQCLHIFNALNQLSEDVPAEAEFEDIVDDVFAKPETSVTHDDTPDQVESARTATNPAEAVSEILSKATEEDPELSRFFSDVIDESQDFSEIDFETRVRKSRPLSPDGGFFYGGANESTIDKILFEQAPEERELEEFTLPAESDAETALADNAEEQHGDATQNIPANIPPQLLEDLQAEHFAQKKAASNALWLVGNVLLMVVFILQAIYFSRHDLAKNPNYRPLLTRACEMVGCTIDVTYDINTIEIIGRDVRSHPSAQNALVAGTTLINNASYPQPYPLLTLTFSDITGKTIAQRRFTPREYLKHGTNIQAGMTPDLPVQVELELVDPGKDAVNFEFRAELDPRARVPS